MGKSKTGKQGRVHARRCFDATEIRILQAIWGVAVASPDDVVQLAELLGIRPGAAEQRIDGIHRKLFDN